MTIKEVSKNNNTQRIIPFSYTNNYKSKDNFENNIAHYFFSDLDDDFTPIKSIGYLKERILYGFSSFKIILIILTSS